MIFEMFFRWLSSKITRKKRCEHDWKDTGWTYSMWRETWGTNGFRHKWKCTKCNKKEKRVPRDPPTNFVYF